MDGAPRRHGRRRVVPEAGGDRRLRRRAQAPPPPPPSSSTVPPPPSETVIQPTLEIAPGDHHPAGTPDHRACGASRRTACARRRSAGTRRTSGLGGAGRTVACAAPHPVLFRPRDAGATTDSPAGFPPAPPAGAESPAPPAGFEDRGHRRHEICGVSTTATCPAAPTPSAPHCHRRAGRPSRADRPYPVPDTAVGRPADRRAGVPGARLFDEKGRVHHWNRHGRSAVGNWENPVLHYQLCYSDTVPLYTAGSFRAAGKIPKSSQLTKAPPRGMHPFQCDRSPALLPGYSVPDGHLPVPRRPSWCPRRSSPRW